MSEVPLYEELETFHGPNTQTLNFKAFGREEMETDGEGGDAWEEEPHNTGVPRS